MNLRRRSLLISVLALVLVLGLCLWFGFQEFPQQLQRLPDGNTLQVIGVTHTKKAAFQTGPPLFRLFAPLIPSQHHEKLHLTTWEGLYPLTVWVRFGRSFRPSDPMASVNTVLRVADENGNYATNRLGSLYHWGHHPVYPISPYSFPRRGRELRLKLFSEDQAKRLTPLAAFEVTNPFQGRFGVWQPSPLPDRQRDQDLTAVLERLESGLPSPRSPLGPWELFESGEPMWTRATFSMQYRGRPTAGWKVECAEISDPTGNRFPVACLEEQRSPGKLVVRFDENLWKESAWRLKITFRQVDEFPDAQTYRFSAVIPAKGVTLPRQELTRMGRTLRMAAVIAPGSSWTHANAFVPTTLVPTVVLRERNTSFDTRVGLMSVRVGGRRIRSLPWGNWVDSGITKYLLPKDTPAGPAQFTFAIQEEREVTFQVRPTIH